jgi:enoyl-CoA hydratase
MTDETTETIDHWVAGHTEELVVVNRGAVRLIVFNRPDKRNAMTADMRRAYANHMAQADADPAVRCVIVTGAHGCFTAGVDIKDRPLGAPMALVRPHPVEAGRAMRKPVIALIDGLCITGGLELALACSFLIGSDRSSYADTHLKIGIFPGWGGVSLLTTAIGARRAAQMQLSGERISAEVALRWGLINEVVPAADLLSHGLKVAQAIALADPAHAQRYVAMSRQIDGMDREHALALELVQLDRLRAMTVPTP